MTGNMRRVNFTLVGAKPSSDFVARKLALTDSSPSLLIGRSSKTKPEAKSAPTNAFFECPVISRRHAQFRLDSFGKLQLVDTSSLHGTLLNGLKITAGRPHSLQHGDVITLGSSITLNAQHFQAIVFQLQIHPAKMNIENTIDLTSPAASPVPRKSTLTTAWSPYWARVAPSSDTVAPDSSHDLPQLSSPSLVNTYQVPDDDEDEEDDDDIMSIHSRPEHSSSSAPSGSQSSTNDHRKDVSEHSRGSPTSESELDVALGDIEKNAKPAIDLTDISDGEPSDIEYYDRRSDPLNPEAGADDFDWNHEYDPFSDVNSSHHSDCSEDIGSEDSMSENSSPSEADMSSENSDLDESNDADELSFEPRGTEPSEPRSHPPEQQKPTGAVDPSASEFSGSRSEPVGLQSSSVVAGSSKPPTTSRWDIQGSTTVPRALTPPSFYTKRPIASQPVEALGDKGLPPVASSAFRPGPWAPPPPRLSRNRFDFDFGDALNEGPPEIAHQAPRTFPFTAWGPGPSEPHPFFPVHGPAEAPLSLPPWDGPSPSMRPFGGPIPRLDQLRVNNHLPPPPPPPPLPLCNYPPLPASFPSSRFDFPDFSASCPDVYKPREMRESNVTDNSRMSIHNILSASQPTAPGEHSECLLDANDAGSKKRKLDDMRSDLATVASTDAYEYLPEPFTAQTASPVQASMLKAPAPTPAERAESPAEPIDQPMKASEQVPSSRSSSPVSYYDSSDEPLEEPPAKRVRLALEPVSIKGPSQRSARSSRARAVARAAGKYALAGVVGGAFALGGLLALPSSMFT